LEISVADAILGEEDHPAGRAAQMIGTKFTETEVMMRNINEAAAESGVWAEVPISRDSTSYLRIF